VQLHEYKNLDLSRKACLLCEKGVFLDKYIDFEHISSLYYMHNFFIEIVVSNQDNHIVEIVPFRTGARLDKFLRNIDLNNLL
jgi:hypothetical protein